MRNHTDWLVQKCLVFMTMEEDNLSRQADEIEALSAIYGDQWCTLDAAARRYNIQITSSDDGQGKQKSLLSLSLEIRLPPDYPTEAPPIYQLSAPWLRGQERMILSRKLEDIYMENIGESVIYLWVEQIREFMLEKAESGVITDNHSSLSNQRSPSQLLEDSWSPEGPLSDEDSELVSPDTSNTSTSLNITMDTDTEDLVCPEIFHGEFVHDRKSVFQAHLAAVTHEKQVQMVMETLLENKKIAEATHNIQAYRIVYKKAGRPVCVHGCVDDGETHAGSRMLHLLQIVDAENVLVVVTRWYGGVHLGPDRFKHINNCTRQMLCDHGYIKDKEDKKKGPKSHKKAK